MRRHSRFSWNDGTAGIVEDIIRHLSGLSPVERGIPFIRQILLEHFEAIIRYQNERQSLLDFRRVGCWYLKRCVGAKTLRIQLNKASSTAEVFHLLQDFPWEYSFFVSGTCFRGERGVIEEIHSYVSGKVQGVGFASL